MSDLDRHEIAKLTEEMRVGDDGMMIPPGMVILGRYLLRDEADR